MGDVSVSGIGLKCAVEAGAQVIEQIRDELGGGKDRDLSFSVLVSWCVRARSQVQDEV